MNKVLIAPAPLKEIEPVYGPVLRSAGFELVFPKRNAQMTEAEVLEQLPGCVASLAGSEPYTPVVLKAAAAQGLKAVCRAGVGYDAVDVPAATELGIFRTTDGGVTWTAFQDGLPRSPIVELRFNSRFNRLFAGTMGRGVYVRDV